MMKLFLFTAAATIAFAVPTLAQMHGYPSRDWMEPQTRAEAEAKAKAHFAKRDLNHDGFITEDEIRAGVDQRMAEMRGREFDRIDADHNGTVTREEFAASHDGPGPRVIERRFERTTPDGDKVNAPGGKPELRVMMMQHGGPGGDHMIMMADTDHDGRISQAEAVAGALKMFDEADTNHDGSVTPEERRAAMQAMGAKMHAPMDDMPVPPPPPKG